MTKLTLSVPMRRQPLHPHNIIVEFTLTAYHLPSMSIGEQGYTANKERGAVIYYSSISRASLPLRVSILATDIIYRLTVQFRYIERRQCL